METEPVSYEFPGHAVGAFARRPMDSSLDQSFPFYSHPTAPYSLPYQAPSSTAYNVNHSLGSQPSHPYHPYYVAQQSISPQPLRLASDQQALQSLPEIRPAKNAINQVTKSSTEPRLGQPPSTSSVDRAEQKPEAHDVDFSTGVDVLMKAIQSKAGSPPVQPSLPPLQHLAPSAMSSYPASYPLSSPSSRYLLTNEGQLSRSGKKRKYTCTLPDCGKSFAQKTHLDIHIRAHTGDKPFICKEPSCGQRFSQLGNLKTHQRRHTGEKPYSCDICHKRFAQRGNVRAHQITHQPAKPFTCLLDSCGKQFTQLGNLKSHQNKFHAATLNNLTARFSQFGDTGPPNPRDREMWEYFATLYKNSNKGIKGRGKDRRISTTKRSGPHAARSGLGPSLESDEETAQARRGSYDHLSMYTGVSSSDGDDPGPYLMDRRDP
ncbi:hypothetical protein NUU61_007128 [Penicillium alfredii]|uniref:C2H2-type domain-containing protein n=1 Tax=Penicillium alfredii TaxID=1506179 RepID=A0A9W9F248_9EURO|nr:uncharacterized protein NUU61_007128 [Penicillium alfredii]KAJ5092258.1 hypothetical protein NUU61_007128 [Penicillium alfredii]